MEFHSPTSGEGDGAGSLEMPEDGSIAAVSGKGLSCVVAGLRVSGQLLECLDASQAKEFSLHILDQVNALWRQCWLLRRRKNHTVPEKSPGICATRPTHVPTA